MEAEKEKDKTVQCQSFTASGNLNEVIKVSKLRLGSRIPFMRRNLVEN